ncbi:MAG: 4Fe-4S dicluster domain-containing protein [Candidatus Competibacter sp.]|jgi:heterodisulfide reductase subunit C|nr:4Fe-4S dicluster domain-containing protein [Candidatus Competibacter sp.]
MNSSLKNAKQTTSLASKVQATAGVELTHCYQCGKCAAGCPVAGDMDMPSCQVLRLLQYETPEFDQQVLQSESIWLCLSCDTCHSRCPQTINTPKIMYFLREEAVRLGLAHPKSKDAQAFHKAFLGSIARHGRLHEIGMLMNYKVRTGHLLQDMTLGSKLYQKGKLELLPHGIEDKAAVKRMFQRNTGDKE